MLNKLMMKDLFENHLYASLVVLYQENYEVDEITTDMFLNIIATKSYDAPIAMIKKLELNQLPAVFDQTNCTVSWYAQFSYMHHLFFVGKFGAGFYVNAKQVGDDILITLEGHYGIETRTLSQIYVFEGTQLDLHDAKLSIRTGLHDVEVISNNFIRRLSIDNAVIPKSTTYIELLPGNYYSGCLYAERHAGNPPEVFVYDSSTKSMVNGLVRIDIREFFFDESSIDQ